MIGKDRPIVVERTENGYIVRPYIIPPVSDIYNIYVFNEMGWASFINKPEDCLLSFIERHFSVGKLSDVHASAMQQRP